MNEIVFEEQPFRVLRVVPIVSDDPDEFLIAMVDLVHVENNLIFPDCGLLRPEDSYVAIPRSKVFLQYHLKGSSQVYMTRRAEHVLEVDSEVIRDQTTVALNHFLGLPKDPMSFIDWTMNTSPCLLDDWKDGARDAILEDPDWKEKWVGWFASASHFNSWVLDEFLRSPEWWEAWIETQEIIPCLYEALEAFVLGEEMEDPTSVWG